MKRIAILTLFHGNNNYGGLLQAYALCEYLNSAGLDAEVIDYKKQKGLSGLFKDKLSTHIDKKGIYAACQLFQYLIRWGYNREILEKKNRKSLQRYAKELAAREKKFQEFRDQVPHSPVYTADTISDCVDQYDVFISGSDQIWKPGVIQDAFVLKFVTNRKKISYASSISVCDIKSRKWFCEYLKTNLSTFSHISVREQAASMELREILNRDVKWVVDPTMLIEKGKWHALSAPRLIDSKYLFAYFLGGDQKQRRLVTAYAKVHDLKVVTIPFASGSFTKEDEQFGDEQLFDADVPGFLSLIRFSEVVFTDSFHAVCFSRAFEKQFLVFERAVSNKVDRMTSRIESVLSLMGLTERLITENSSIDRLEPINYSLVEEKLHPAIEASRCYLLDAIDK